MTLADLIQDTPDLPTLRGLWLVFDANIATALAAKQAEHGSPVHRIAPIAGPDGRFALCADLLTEIATGGLHAAIFARLNADRFGEVAVETRADLEAAGWFHSTEEDA